MTGRKMKKMTREEWWIGIEQDLAEFLRLKEAEEKQRLEKLWKECLKLAGGRGLKKNIN